MVAEAEKFSAEDDAQKERVKARNPPENFRGKVRHTADERAAGGQDRADDKAAVEKDGLEWLDAHQRDEAAELHASSCSFTTVNTQGTTTSSRKLVHLTSGRRCPRCCVCVGRV